MLNFLSIAVSTFPNPIKIIFNVINARIVFMLIFTLVIKMALKIDIRNIEVEIGAGIRTFLSILNNNLYSLVIINYIIADVIISINISIVEILFSISIGK